MYTWCTDMVSRCPGDGSSSQASSALCPEEDEGRRPQGLATKDHTGKAFVSSNITSF